MYIHKKNWITSKSSLDNNVYIKKNWITSKSSLDNNVYIKRIGLLVNRH